MRGKQVDGLQRSDEIRQGALQCLTKKEAYMSGTQSLGARIKETEEGKRLFSEPSVKLNGWRKWGPYLSERQWGTVREDYSANGSAWEFFPHDQCHDPGLRRCQ